VGWSKNTRTCAISRFLIAATVQMSTVQMSTVQTVAAVIANYSVVMTFIAIIAQTRVIANALPVQSSSRAAPCGSAGRSGSPMDRAAGVGGAAAMTASLGRIIRVAGAGTAFGSIVVLMVDNGGTTKKGRSGNGNAKGRRIPRFLEEVRSLLHP
jgi:hypothetical protein